MKTLASAMAACVAALHYMTAMIDATLSVETIQTPLERVVFGSCNDQYEDQPMWQTIMVRKPQLWLWMGDVVCIDNTKQIVVHMSYG